MKGFDFSQYLERLKGVEDMDLLRDELGDNYEDILAGNIPMEEAKQIYNEAKVQKWSNMFENALYDININDKDSFLIDDSINIDVDNLPMDNMEERAQSIISGILTAEKMGNEKRAEELKDVMKAYIGTGYNFYPLMRCMTKHIKDYAKENKVDMEAGGEGFGESKPVYDGLVLMKNLEKSSPYNDLFVLAEKLGQVKNQLAMSANDDSLDFDSLSDLEANLSNMLDDEIKKYDLSSLESVAKNKMNSETEFSGRNSDLHRGLLALNLKIKGSIEKQVNQNQEDMEM